MWSAMADPNKQQENSPALQLFSLQDWEAYPFAGEEKLAWFREAKLGLFLHVGIAAVGMAEIGWARHTHKFPDPQDVHGEVPTEVYDGWATQIKFENFNADEWIDLAVDCGFKYVVIITKHHDGFHMWDTAYSEHKITNSPMKRDYLKELVDACHAKGMPVGFYYSQRDWYHPDYEPIDPAVAVPTNQLPLYELKEGQQRRAGEKHEKYIQYMHNAITELMTKYGKIDILWWDALWCGGMFCEDMWRSLQLEQKVRELQPHILINNRASVPGDFDTPERLVGHVQRERAWETCIPLCPGWSHTEDGPRPMKEIVGEFIGSICGDGNYLLSVGCLPNGALDNSEVLVMRRFGGWVKQHGEAIYKTRSGPWNPNEFGGSVYRDDTVYVHLLNRPESGRLQLPLEHYEIDEMTCLTEEQAHLSVVDHTLIIDLPNTEFLDIIVRLKMKHLVTVPVEGLAPLSPTT